jgi:hypothetical protein
MKKKMAGLAVMIMMITGCAATKTWHSSPAVSTVENPAIIVSLAPLAAENGIFDRFNLTIENKEEKPISIDWNQSRYLYNGTANGRFVYRGIDLKQLQTGALPKDTIAAHALYQKEIAPAKLLARGPIRDKTSHQGWHGMTLGYLPAGENGVMLVFNQTDQLIPITLMLRIEEKRAN